MKGNDGKNCNDEIPLLGKLKIMKASRFERKRVGAWSFFYLPELEDAGVLHGFCTGGSPSNLFDAATRRSFLQALSFKDLAVMTQVHGKEVHVISDGERPRYGDGLVITEKNVAGVIRTADCLPIVLCDPGRSLVSIVHAGWRGTAKGILTEALASLEHLGMKRESAVALLGPSIGPCCYEVRDDVRSLFHAEGFPENIFVRMKDSLFLDLKQANAWILNEAGITEVYDIGLCTSCRKDQFYSYRRGDRGKRQISFVSLK